MWPILTNNRPVMSHLVSRALGDRCMRMATLSAIREPTLRAISTAMKMEHTGSAIIQPNIWYSKDSEGISDLHHSHHLLPASEWQRWSPPRCPGCRPGCEETRPEMQINQRLLSGPMTTFDKSEVGIRGPMTLEQCTSFVTYQRPESTRSKYRPIRDKYWGQVTSLSQ